MEKIGYKCFNADMTNRYGMKLEVGKTYQTNSKIKFGNDGHGFHFCKNIEDTFRYFDAMNDEVAVCLVKGTGDIDEYKDDYYGYYDMYSAENIEILKQLTREEIIEIGLNLTGERVRRFISGFRLTEGEIELFREKFKSSISVQKTIDYYQFKKSNSYKK